MNTSDNSRYIYVFEFNDHHAYIGLSYSLHNRCRQHLTEKKSTICKLIKETGCMYNFKVLTNVSVEDIVKQEILWIKRYKDEGWILINKEPDESANDGSPKYSYEYCKMIASRYAYRQSFQCGNSLVYNFALRHGLFDEICKHMEGPTPYNLYWTAERCAEEALKYTKRRDFQEASPGTYKAAKRMDCLILFVPIWQELLSPLVIGLRLDALGKTNDTKI